MGKYFIVRIGLVVVLVLTLLAGVFLVARGLSRASEDRENPFRYEVEEPLRPKSVPRPFPRSEPDQALLAVSSSGEVYKVIGGKRFFLREVHYARDPRTGFPFTAVKIVDKQRQPIVH